MDIETFKDFEEMAADRNISSDSLLELFGKMAANQNIPDEQVEAAWSLLAELPNPQVHHDAFLLLKIFRREIPMNWGNHTK